MVLHIIIMYYYCNTVLCSKYRDQLYDIDIFFFKINKNIYHYNSTIFLCKFCRDLIPKRNPKCDLCRNPKRRVTFDGVVVWIINECLIFKSIDIIFLRTGYAYLFLNSCYNKSFRDDIYFLAITFNRDIPRMYLNLHIT